MYNQYKGGSVSRKESRARYPEDTVRRAATTGGRRRGRSGSGDSNGSPVSPLRPLDYTRFFETRDNSRVSPPQSRTPVHSSRLQRQPTISSRDNQEHILSPRPIRSVRPEKLERHLESHHDNRRKNDESNAALSTKLPRPSTNHGGRHDNAQLIKRKPLRSEPTSQDRITASNHAAVTGSRPLTSSRAQPESYWNHYTPQPPARHQQETSRNQSCNLQRHNAQGRPKNRDIESEAYWQPVFRPILQERPAPSYMPGDDMLHFNRPQEPRQTTRRRPNLEVKIPNSSRHNTSKPLPPPPPQPRERLLGLFKRNSKAARFREELD